MLLVMINYLTQSRIENAHYYYDDSLELPKVILKRKSTFLQIEQRIEVKGFLSNDFQLLEKTFIDLFYSTYDKCVKCMKKIKKWVNNIIIHCYLNIAYFIIRIRSKQTSICRHKYLRFRMGSIYLLTSV